MLEKLNQLARVFKKSHVEYLFIGKSGAILYGYPGTTQDIDIFPKKGKTNCKNIVNALKELGFALNKELEDAVLAGKDFIQIRGGPIPLDIVFAPDGIKSFEKAKKRARVVERIYPCASLEDIIESKKQASRRRDKEELPRLELFAKELQRGKR